MTRMDLRFVLGYYTSQGAQQKLIVSSINSSVSFHFNENIFLKIRIDRGLNKARLMNIATEYDYA